MTEHDIDVAARMFAAWLRLNRDAERAEFTFRIQADVTEVETKEQRRFCLPDPA